MCDEVLEILVPQLRGTYGNASSIHQFGQEAKQRLEVARKQVAWMLCGEPKEIVFLSGGTEANNLAIFGVVRGHRAAAKHVITTEIEHPAVLNACQQLEREGVEVAYLPVGASGVVDAGEVKAALRPETVLITVMHVNNEIGTIQPVEEIGAIAREAGVPFHSDGVQAAGKLVLNDTPPVADLYSLSAHKFHAPKGVGALFVRQGLDLERVLHGGHQERDRRPGTQNVPGAAAMGTAAKWVRKNVRKESERVTTLRDRLERGILERVPETSVNGSGSRVGNTTNICFNGAGAEAMLIALDLKGYAVSTGSACSSGAVEPSHVLTGIGLTPDRARSSVRFSLGRSNDKEQVDGLIEAVEAAAAHLRRVAPGSTTSA